MIALNGVFKNSEDKNQMMNGFVANTVIKSEKQ
jgi:hypothetical protein